MFRIERFGVECKSDRSRKMKKVEGGLREYDMSKVHRCGCKTPEGGRGGRGELEVYS